MFKRRYPPAFQAHGPSGESSQVLCGLPRMNI
jgi:hypothetical protein